MTAMPCLSVVIATYNRRALLERLLRQLAHQTLPRERYEVVVVDDGSAEPVRPSLEALALPCALRVETQANAGAAAARHRGVLAARGEVLVLLDDDMEVAEGFLEHHLALHPPGTRRVVLGRLRHTPGVDFPLFERWHMEKLEGFAEGARAGTTRIRGNDLYTGNVSMRREDYLAVGGFDHALGHSEDAELGLRLERAGVEFLVSEEAGSLHGSDHTSVDKWRRRARQYGMYEHRISRKHPDLPHANPWRYLRELNPVSRPLMAATVLAPAVAGPLASAAYAAASLADRLGQRKVAHAGTTLVFGLEYFRGLRGEVGSAPAAVHDAAAFLAAELGRGGVPALERLALVARVLEEVRADQATLRRYEARYGHASPSEGRLTADVVQKVGLQLMAAYRVMRALRDAGLTQGAKVVSRLIRHLYGSDIHWDATFAPGVMVVHGMGLAISHAARVEQGCILFQHVTLGAGIDPVTRETGSPHLEENVHVGPGATLLGPIRVGAGSKVMAGAVLTRSVPPMSLVEAPEPAVRARRPAVVPGSREAAEG